MLKQTCDDDLVIYLVGNKADLVNMNNKLRRVSKDEAVFFSKGKAFQGFGEWSALRNTNINELAELLYKYDKENIDSNYDCLYLDVQYIYSANKIKAMVVLYGDEFNSVTIKEIRLYISEMFKNENMNKDKLRRMINMAKCLGACRFFKELFIFKEQNKNGKSDKFMKYIENQVMDKEDKEEYTQLCAQKKEVKNEEKEATKIYTSMNEEEYNRAILNVI